MGTGAGLVARSDTGWRYRHAMRMSRLEKASEDQVMSRKGSCIGNGAAEQVFDYMKEELSQGEHGPAPSLSRWTSMLAPYIGAPWMCWENFAGIDAAIQESRQ